jgi:hypothetical protein
MRTWLVPLPLLILACGSSRPPAGAEGGPCNGNGTCNGSLSCKSNLCVDLGSGGSTTVGQGGAGGGGSNAATCVESTYPLGCIGDGRTPSLTTEGSKPARSCTQDQYAYVKLDLVIGTIDVPSSEIDHCTLEIRGDDQSWSQIYDLPSGSIEGTPYGCSPGQTPIRIGRLSYSCCNPGNTLGSSSTLGFWLSAYVSDGSLVGFDHVFVDCARPEGGMEVGVMLSATYY